MDKILLLSAIVMMVVVPLRAARVPDPRRSMRKALTHFFAFNILYWVAVLFLWFAVWHGAEPTRLLHPVNQAQTSD